MNGHEINEERSLWLHRAVAEKLLNDPSILAAARRRVQGWLAAGATHRHYAESWHQVLALSAEEVARRLIDRGETMRALRQSSPFAGALDPRERWEILRQAQEALGR